MTIRIINMLTGFKTCKHFYFIPSISYVKDDTGSGIWICWLNVGMLIGNFK